jgi:NADPH-dependent 2,4-dienoyl-CoA reductase/sulfur reductase-like enzyme/nitrite reductase/ring-hydroxylating ferredoxin subunit
VSDEHTDSSGPDFRRGIPLSEIPEGGMLGGHVDGKPVLVARHGEDVFGVGGQCTHYGAPLADGLVVGETVRCPWHHACFSLRTGDALRAPALNPLARWTVEQRNGMVFVTGELASSTRSQAATRRATADAAPASVIIVGAGAAGDAAAETLRREGYAGPITLIGADAAPPYDRPNLSKDFLAGSAPEEWIPLRASDFYREKEISLLVGTSVTSIDRSRRHVVLDDRSTREFGALLLATGSDPVHLPIPAAIGSRVHYLRTLADSRAIIAASAGAGSAVVLGAGFIGLEVAASLRARGLEVHVVSPDARPLERIMGPDLGDFIRGLHEAKGVTFHLGHTASRIDAETVTLDNGEQVGADLVVAGVGVRPNDQLAADAGLDVEHGVLVDRYLETSERGIFAAGDIARFPDPRTGQRIRVEHWVVAQRMGQTAARNILGRGEPFDAVPFFWSRHYDVSIRYVGHAERWDELQVSGSLERRDCSVTFSHRGKPLAVATVGRDVVSLEAEVAFEEGDVDALVPAIASSGAADA